jgi:acyl carrier protein
MEQNEAIIEQIKLIIQQSCGIDPAIMHANSTIFDELSIDSIDMVDILFQLERHYDIELKISEIEQQSKLEMGDEPFEIDQVITPKGLEVLRRRMPEIDPAKLTEGLTMFEVIKLINIQSMANMVAHQLAKKNS